MNNKFNNFRPMSTMPEMYNNINNRPTGTLIGKIDYSNPRNLIHDNIGDNILTESLVEHRLYIDSSDRSPTSQPNPFSYYVNLNPAHGDSNLAIPKTFERVKYVRIDSIILPKYTKFIKNELVESRINSWVLDGSGSIDMFKILDTSGNVITPDNLDQMILDDEFDSEPLTNAKRLAFIKQRLISRDQVKHIQKRLKTELETMDIGDIYYNGVAYEDIINRINIGSITAPSIDYDYYLDISGSKWYLYTKDTSSSSLLYDDRYVIFVIDELKNKQVYGSNKILGNAFGLIYPNLEFNDHFYQGSTFQSSVIFADTDLISIKRLTFRFYDTDGTELTFSHLNSKDAYSIKDPRHPNHRHLQNQISIIIGEIDPSISKQAGFAR